MVREVQRLKAEAGRMVALLAAEYEEENLTEERRRSLTAEVGIGANILHTNTSQTVLSSMLLFTSPAPPVLPSHC